MKKFLQPFVRLHGAILRFRVIPLFIFEVLLCSFPLFAQHALVGTWDMVSIKGINADGQEFSIDTTTVRETKIITPTHYILIAMDVRGDSLVFNRSYAGTIRLDGNKYNEMPLQASVQIFDNVKTDFTWKVEGDIFTQSGTFTRPDGKKIVLHAMVFKRANRPRTPIIWLSVPGLNCRLPLQISMEPKIHTPAKQRHDSKSLHLHIGCG